MIRIIGALGIGALAMYFFDPENGRRRRAQMRDKAVHYGNEAHRYADETYKDLRHRAEGVVAKARGSKVDIDLTQPHN